MAVIELCSKLCFQPLGHLGEKLGQFFHEVLGANSYMASIGVSLLSLIILILIILVLGGYTIRLPFFLGAIEPRHHRLGHEKDEDALLNLMSELTELKNAVKSLSQQPQAITLHKSPITHPVQSDKCDTATSIETDEPSSNQVKLLDNKEDTLIENVTSFAEKPNTAPDDQQQQPQK